MHKVILISLVLILISGCKPQPEPEHTSELVSVSKVHVQTLVPRVYQQNIRTFGVLEAVESVTLSSEFSARVEKIHFSEGQQVEAGQLMLELDSTHFEMQVKRAEADLQRSAARLEEGRLLLERREELFTQRLVSQEQMEVVRTALINAEVNQENALIGLSQARNDLTRASIVSPVSGRVAVKDVEVGEVVSPGQPLAEMQVTNIMRVVTYVTEQEINSVQPGAESVVTTPGVRGREYTARIESRGDGVDSVTGNFPVKLTVENSDGLLKSGMTAVVLMAGLEIDNVLMIPDSAVVDRNRRRVVYRVTDGTAEEIEPVLAATLSQNDIPVLHGLSAGDELVVGGLETVVDGKKVELIRSSDTQSTESQVVTPVNVDESKTHEGS